MSIMDDRDDRLVEDVLIRQAAEWHVGNTQGPLSDEEHIAFGIWLRRSPMHVREYLKISRVTGHLREALAGLPADILESVDASILPDDDNVVELHPGRSERSHALVRQRRWWDRSKLLAVASVAIGSVLLLSWITSHVGDASAIIVPHGGQRTVSLEDGSVMHLNSQSTVRVRYSARERLIELAEGQVLFHVAHEPDRPFRVRVGGADGTDVIAVGTQFDVRATDELTAVTVVEGKVEVIPLSGSPPDIGSGGEVVDISSQPLNLSAGEQVRLGAGIPAPKAQAVDIRKITAWVKREILFDGQRLDEVAQEFNRYTSTPIQIDDPILRERRVSGIFGAYDVDSFLDFLKQYDVEIERSHGVIRVRARSAVVPDLAGGSAEPPPVSQ